MITISVKDDIAKALAKLSALEPRQFPFIAATAINNTAKIVQKEIRAEMERTIDKPRPFTLNSLRTIYAKKTDLQAVITFKDGKAGGGRSAEKYLRNVINGGQRKELGYERYFEGLGVMPSGFFAVPAQGLSLDANGNIPKATLNRIARGLKSKSDGKRAQFFSIQQAGGLPLGIYERNGRQSRMLIAFVSAKPTYNTQVDFYGVAERQVRVNIQEQLRIASEKAIATSTSGTIERLFAASIL